MNIYNCWYQGNQGYACRTHGKKWMFVPELGQPNSNVYKQLSVQDLIFKNLSDKHYEIALDSSKYNFNLFKTLKSLFLPAYKPATVGGLLFATS